MLPGKKDRLLGKNNKKVLIHDDGTITDHRDILSRVFIIICIILTAVLALLGIGALVVGYI